MFSRPFADFHPTTEDNKAGAKVSNLFVQHARAAVDAGLVAGDPPDIAATITSPPDGLIRCRRYSPYLDRIRPRYESAHQPMLVDPRLDHKPTNAGGFLHTGRNRAAVREEPVFAIDPWPPTKGAHDVYTSNAGAERNPT